MNSEEQAIIQAAQEGNILAFESLVKRYDRQVLQLALSLVNHRQDAEDIYQEVFVRVYKNLHRFQFRSEFSTWLYRVVVNACINYLKKKQRTKTLPLDGSTCGKEQGLRNTLPGSEKNPEESILNQELSGEIDEALEKLSPRQKMVFVLRHYHGHKLQEIAEIMNCSLGTVKNYLFRSTQRMQQLLREYSATRGKNDESAKRSG
ncbi:MAG: RNA polymerase sigma factor [bacterium]